jgi:hypothetical protein
MKKIIIALFVLFGIAQAQAQVTFRPGIRAGVNFSHFTDGDFDNNNFTTDLNGNSIRVPKDEFKSKTDFYVGIYGALRLTRFYTLQPEVTYSRQGSKIESFDVTNGIVSKTSTQIDLSYISVAIINKFTFNDKFNIHVGPTIDVIAEKGGTDNYTPYANQDYYYYDNYYYDTESDIDLAFVLGVGYNFTKSFGLEARVKKGIIPVLDWGDDHTNVVFSAGLTYTFDMSGAGSTAK